MVVASSEGEEKKRHEREYLKTTPYLTHYSERQLRWSSLWTSSCLEVSLSSHIHEKEEEKEGGEKDRQGERVEFPAHFSNLGHTSPSTLDLTHSYPTHTHLAQVERERRVKMNEEETR